MKRNSLLSAIALTLVSAPSLADIKVVEGDASLLKGHVQTQISKSGRYIVQLKGPTTVELSQASSGFASKSSRTQLLKAQAQGVLDIQQQVMSEAGVSSVSNNFVHSFNGFSAKLDGKQIERLRRNPRVLKLWSDELAKPQTDSTTDFLGLTTANGLHTNDIKGDGVIVGILDTGISPDNSSFADDGSYTDPAGLGWSGECDQGSEAEGDSFACNNKLIGARFFNNSFKDSYDLQLGLGEVESPRDVDGHGSHTASTAAGNAGVAASLLGTSLGKNISGMAPRARIAAYKVCWNSDYSDPDTGEDQAGCFYSDSMAAVDQSILDGVDVLNYSIGGSPTNLSTPIAIAMLRASDAGIFVAASAGNSGPGASTVGNPAPWVTTVAASTKSGTRADVAASLNVIRKGKVRLRSTGVPSSFSPLIEVGVKKRVAVAEPLEACGEGALDNAEDLAGKWALVSRGSCAFVEKARRAQASGAAGVVVFNNQDGAAFSMGGAGSDITIPAVMVTKADGEGITAQIAKGNSKIKVGGFKVVNSDLTPNVMADFSSRGPNLSTFSVIKPDITAPGVSILAATSDQPMFGRQGETQAYLQGTSMSSPHIAGLAALGKEQHPDWSPAQIKSAMMTTARTNVVKEDGTTAADVFDFGSGHVEPNSASDPGLTYDIQTEDYLTALCGLQYDATVASQSFSCEELTSKKNRKSKTYAADPSNLNYPSIAVDGLIQTSKTYYREVKNVSDQNSYYVAQVDAPPGIDVEVKIKGKKSKGGLMSLAPNETARYSMTFSKNTDVVVNEWTFGSITWVDHQNHKVRSPIAVMPRSDQNILPKESVAVKLKNGKTSFKVKSRYNGGVNVQLSGLNKAVLLDDVVGQDADKTFSFPGDIQEGGGASAYFLTIPASGLIRATLDPAANEAITDDVDIDLFLYSCVAWSCSRIGASATDGSAEEITVVDTPDRLDAANGTLYLLIAHGYDLGGAEEISYELDLWATVKNLSSTSAITPNRIRKGKNFTVTLGHKGAQSGDSLLGTIDFIDDDGVNNGRTIIEVEVK